MYITDNCWYVCIWVTGLSVHHQGSRVLSPPSTKEEKLANSNALSVERFVNVTTGVEFSVLLEYIVGGDERRRRIQAN